MKARINKIINWKEKEYAHIIEDEPNQFCDLCAFSELCGKVNSKELPYEESPMAICAHLCLEANDTHFAMFIEASKAENYIKARNDSI